MIPPSVGAYRIRPYLVHYQTGGEKGLCDTPLPELFRSPSHSIGAIIRGYKSSVTKQINLSDHGGSAWQRNYYEHIIRDEKSYMRISDYIISNPANWTNDKFYIK
jgi:putative transposase